MKAIAGLVPRESCSSGMATAAIAAPCSRDLRSMRAALLQAAHASRCDPSHEAVALLLHAPSWCCCCADAMVWCALRCCLKGAAQRRACTCGRGAELQHGPLTCARVAAAECMVRVCGCARDLCSELVCSGRSRLEVVEATKINADFEFRVDPSGRSRSRCLHDSTNPCLS